MPSRIIHVIVRLFERVDWRDIGGLSTGADGGLHPVRWSAPWSGSPQFDAPIHAGRQEKIGKVDSALERMKIDAGNGCIVGFVNFPGVDSGFLAGTVEPVADVDAALFGSDPESACFIVGKVEAGDGDFPCLAVVSGMCEFQCFLGGEYVSSAFGTRG